MVSLSAYPGDHRLFAFVTYVCFIGIIVYFMYNFDRLGVKDNFYSALASLCIFLLSLVWITWSLSHGILLQECEHGAGYITILLCVSWIGDASAYYIGSRFGSHKVTQISPNKSWEGVIAEIVFAILLSSIFKYFEVLGIFPWMQLPPVSYGNYVLFGLLIGVMGVIGDVFESLVKRAGFAKDSGIFFPGHGGVLDRFDAFLLVVPALYYYIVFVINTRALEEIDWSKYGNLNFWFQS
uniref:Phosphatidate cytidylyltransferase n=1 Tax=Arcella intermedia TaxID=1963864 RepID=A0A6B2LG46_9EUKA